jgi:hypothetical protein
MSRPLLPTPSPKRGAVLGILLALAAPVAAAENDEPKVTEVPEAVVKKFKLDTEFYKKHVD